MLRFLLDTNIIIALTKADPRLQARMSKVNAGDTCISPVVLAELEYGIAKSAQPERSRQRLEHILADIQVEPMDSDFANHYGRIRASLEAAGTPISANDMFIAAHAMALGATLVTHNTREFSRVPGLMIEDWLEQA